ncbi:NCS2 family nucleobase:cation symporter [Aquibacillus koreensis]|uniref:NCS2 family nucleobase:cation symporter n=1 Tax=Aquibacillus koreensis TaxID=279446 RepID=A0A9X3WIY2_9BACI|nr:solute carrier family 23 protein [Aquibacillus koreensis]MCT2538037.1 NCS2 family nucleobase:cation symporter [Aquibacillus koreensis]MDC3420560.1 NCS2 family nucleobase:cation symporter [Aquibacillus koreensis]
MTAKNMVMDVNEVPKLSKWIIFSIQHLFAMFGATILVPFLTGLSPAVALVSSGTGTLAYLLITKGKIPAYLGSSFAFITPIIVATEASGVPGVMVGSFLAGLVYGLLALLIGAFGLDWLMKVLPPIVVGPVIIVIGLGLAPTAIDMAMNVDGSYSGKHFAIAIATLAITIIGSLFFKGFFGLIPILIGIVSGYIISLFAGIVDTSGVSAAWDKIANAGSVGDLFGSIFLMPDFVLPFVHYAPFEVLSLNIAAIMVPVAAVTIAEHIGDQMVLSKVAGRNFIKKPGLHRSILGDGVATMIASVLGGPPNTTYGENIGVLAITRVFSVFVIGGAAVLAISFGFIGIITEVIASIPTAVMGGVSILLFGIIASSGLRMLIDNQVDLGEKRNLIVSSVILVIGIGGALVRVNVAGVTIEVAGMALATIIGIVLNLVLPGKESGFGNGSMFQADEEVETEK